MNDKDGAPAFIAVVLAIGLACFMVKVIADRQVAKNLDRIATVLEQHGNN